MSLKNCVFIFSVALFLSCTDKNKEQSPFVHSSESERDSLAQKYFDISMTYYQPSDLHRMYRDSALMVDPSHAAYRERLSYSYKKTGEHIKAMQILNKAVEDDIAEGKTFALQYRAWSLLYFYRDYKGTINDVDKILSMTASPSNLLMGCHGEPCLLLKGQALYKLNAYKEAIEVFEQLLKAEEENGFNPTDNFLAYFYLGRCYTELEEYKKALHYYTEQLNDYEEFTEIHFQLGKIYSLEKDNKKAAYHFNRALELLSAGYKMGEPYFERFDEVFKYQIERELLKLSKK